MGASVTEQQQISFEGMPRRLLQAAPSRLNTYADCPRRYRMTYLDRPAPPKGPPWAHNSLGAAVHTALANWWKLPRDRRITAAAGELVDRAWLVDGFRDKIQCTSTRLRARAMVERYVAGLNPDDEPLGLERTIAFKTERAAFFGRVDRIDDRADEGLVVVDYKTGRHVLSVDDARTSLALAVYAVGVARTLRRACRRVELHHLPTGSVVAWDHSDEGLERHVRRADAIAADIGELDDRHRQGVSAAEADEMYPASVSAFCGWCDFNRVCTDGSAQVQPRPSWAALGE